MCYRRVLELGKTPSYADAAFRLARLELKAGKTQRAIKRLRELVSAFGHKEASELLKVAEKKQEGKVFQLIAQGDRAYQSGLYTRAKERYEEALEALRSTEGESEIENELLSKALKCQQALDSAFREREGLKAGASYPPCPDCRSELFPGIVPCSRNCGAKSRCPICKGWGITLCPNCYGLGVLLPQPSRRNIGEALKRTLFKPGMVRRTLREATNRIELALLGLPQQDLVHLSLIHI